MKIYVADSRKDIVLREKDITPQDLYMRLYQSRELPYTLAEFLRLPADHQNELKDTGGFYRRYAERRQAAQQHRHEPQRNHARR